MVIYINTRENPVDLGPSYAWYFNKGASHFQIMDKGPQLLYKSSNLNVEILEIDLERRKPKIRNKNIVLESDFVGIIDKYSSFIYSRMYDVL